jgi:hypothetical protein
VDFVGAVAAVLSARHAQITTAAMKRILIGASSQRRRDAVRIP